MALLETREAIKKWLDKNNINFYIIGEDLSVDVKGSVLLSSSVGNLPIKFKYVSGDFDCTNLNLTTLVGCPESVGGHFNCGNNKLTTLFGCPVSVGGDFSCYYNKLVNLEYCPVSVGGNVFDGQKSLSSAFREIRSYQ